jgi:outer membrane receptor protein involved in Fe transport
MSSSIQLSAQTWSIVGRILADENVPLEVAAITVYSSDSAILARAATDDNGLFSLTVGTPGRCSLAVSAPGYAGVTSELELTSATRTVICPDIILATAETELRQVEIVARRRQTTHRLDGKVIEASGLISSAGGTAADILAQTPSVQTDVNGEISFRGLSGFKVYIDGKPSSLTGTAALEQIPAGRVESMEIITTPSARNEADGIAGIVNVNTKKQLLDGWSGTLNAAGSSVASRSLDFHTSFKKGGFGWLTSGEVSRRYLKSDFSQHKLTGAADTVASTDIAGTRESYVDLYSLRSGVELQRGQTLWSLSAEARYRVRNRGGALHYDDTRTSGNGTVNVAFDGRDFVNLHDMTYRGELGFDRRFDREGHRLTGSFLAFYEANAMEFFYTDLFDTGGRRTQGHRAWEHEYRFTAQGNLDYILPFRNARGKFEAGYSFFTYTEDGDYRIDFFNPASGVFERRDDLYATYLFRRDIHALYSMVSGERASFSYRLGLRGEFVHRLLESNREWAEHVSDKFDLFPSVHLAREFGRGGTLTFGYSRRITQPQLFYMEPYVVYVDFYTAQCGNPKILPEYTNSFELTYALDFGDHSASASAFHRTRRDKIERLRVAYRPGVTLDSMANVGDDYSTGVELVVSFRPAKVWTFDLNGSLYRYSVVNRYQPNGENTRSLNRQFAFNNNFELPTNTRIRLESHYAGPSASTQGRTEDFFYFNLTLRQQFFDRRLSATLGLRDLLSTAKYVNTQSSAGVFSKTVIHPRSPLVTLAISYSFNNFKSQKRPDSVSHDLFEGVNR